MNIRNLLNNILNEELNVGDFDSDGGKWKAECFNRGERDIPHIHILTAKHKKSASRLDVAEYFIHEDKRYIMNSSEKAKFNNFMDSPCKHNPELTNWQFCIIRWNATHPRKLSSDLKDKPNYLNLS